MMPKIWKFRDSTANVAQIPTSFAWRLWRHQNNKKFLICYELEIAFFTWNQLFCPLRMKHRCLKFITNSFQDKINLKFAILINFQNQNLPKLKCVFLFLRLCLSFWGHVNLQHGQELSKWNFPRTNQTFLAISRVAQCAKVPIFSWKYLFSTEILIPYEKLSNWFNF